MKVHVNGDGNFGSDVRAMVLGHGHELVTADGSADVAIIIGPVSDFNGDARQLGRAGAIAYHPALLPLHPSADPIGEVLRAGEPVTGGTVYAVGSGDLTGPVLAQRHVFVRSGDTISSLWRRALRPLGLELLEEVLGELAMAHGAGCLDDVAALGRAQIALGNLAEGCDDGVPEQAAAHVRVVGRRLNLP